MAIENFLIFPGITTYELCPTLYERGLDEAQCDELLRCYDALRIWPEKFTHLGELLSLDHLSDNDDPPDVRAHFLSGATLDLEHTSIEPSHRHWADSIRGSVGGNILPVSKEYKNRKDIIKDLNPWNGGAWENVTDTALARHNAIINAMTKKIKKHSHSGVLVMDGTCHRNDIELKDAIRSACESIQSVNGWGNWVFVFADRHNTLEFYSTIFSKDIPFEERQV